MISIEVVPDLEECMACGPSAQVSSVDLASWIGNLLSGLCIKLVIEGARHCQIRYHTE